ncbi:MAG: 2-dehydro-3-deoxygalactonokinase [Thalassotalea sp.]|nr:2-dehydro-3-deoxygalactonokinase [Thalassotalea sp.]
MMSGLHFITIDWGTSHLRAFLCCIDQQDELSLIKRVTGLGVTKITSSFEQELFDCISPWTEEYGKLPILMAGQIGSSIGWKETQYLACPTSPKSVASACLQFESRGHQVTIVPGLHCSHNNNYRDVLRGEELQVLGWLAEDASHSKGRHLICLPGTHTKWVLVNNGQVLKFKTAMTGELFDLLSNHSVLIQRPTTEFNEPAFKYGAKYTLASELGSFIHGLFSVRSKQLFNELTPEHATSYLSGMLIGSDVRAALNATEWDFNELDSVNVIGNRQLSEYFTKVLAMLDIGATIHNVEKVTLAGFLSIVRDMRTMGLCNPLSKPNTSESQTTNDDIDGDIAP